MLKVLGEVVEGVLLHEVEEMVWVKQRLLAVPWGHVFPSLLKKPAAWAPWNRTSKTKISHKSDGP